MSTNTQHEEMMATLRAILAILERNETAASEDGTPANAFAVLTDESEDGLFPSAVAEAFEAEAAHARERGPRLLTFQPEPKPRGKRGRK